MFLEDIMPFCGANDASVLDLGSVHTELLAIVLPLAMPKKL